MFESALYGTRTRPLFPLRGGIYRDRSGSADGFGCSCSLIYRIHMWVSHVCRGMRWIGSWFNQYLRLAAALGARTSGAAAGDGVTAAAATAAAAAADGAAAPSQLHGMAGNLYPVFVTDR